MNKKVLILIVTYNSSDYIGDCLSSLSNITYPKDSFEILIVDNASSDSSIEYIKEHFSEIKIITNQKNIGFAAGNNVGFKYAIANGFDYVYLLNQDTVVKPDFLNQAVNLAISDQKIGAVQSKLLLYHDQGKINSIGNEIHYLGFAFAGGYLLPDTQIKSKEITYPSGASTLLSTLALKDVGVFNEEFFMYHEDTDLGWRLWLGGYKVMLAAESVVYHKYEFSKSIKKYYYMERNRFLMIFQNYRLATFFLISPALVAINIAMLGYSFLTGWWPQYFRILFYFLNPISWIKLFKTRRQVQAKRQVSDKEIIKRFVGKIDFQEISNPLVRYVVNPVFSFYWRLILRLISW